MTVFDDEIRLDAAGNGVFTGTVSPSFNIGANPNGGYLAAIAANGLRLAMPAHPDPLSLTVHYLQPGLGGQACRVETQVLRAGRQLSTARASFVQDGSARLEVLAAYGDLADATALAELSPAIPELPPPQACPGRSAGSQGVMLTILDRLDIRLHPDEAEPGRAGHARVSGWIRFRDGREPDPLACLLFADAFPPPVFGLLGAVGWVPTVELTVHVRRRPAPGWMRGLFQVQDLQDGRMVEDGALWDAQGNLVVRSRQLALLRRPAPKA